ncbi:MAG: DUF6507 family protein [bacterium]|nr:DUF6507 family protein [bacterium]
MSKWNLQPEPIGGILDNVQTSAQEAAAELGDEKFTSISDDLALYPDSADGPLRNGLFGSVPAAVANVLSAEKSTIEGIFNRIRGGVMGVAAATTEYVNSDGDMSKAAAAQEAGIESSVTGNFTFFDQYGYNDPPEESPHG